MIKYKIADFPTPAHNYEAFVVANYAFIVNNSNCRDHNAT